MTDDPNFPNPVHIEFCGGPIDGHRIVTNQLYPELNVEHDPGVSEKYRYEPTGETKMCGDDVFNLYEFRETV